MAAISEIIDFASLAKGIVQRLASLQQHNGNLFDPVSGVALPPEHYGTVLFAAACTLVGDSPECVDAAARAVRYYLRLPRLARGAHELNNLGLLCVYRRWQKWGLAPDFQSSIATYLHSMPFASLTSHVTNNWHAMRAVCLAQRSRLFESAEDYRAARVCLSTHVLPLQGSDGLFADYPAVGQEGNRATPLAYHAKFCAMLAMFLQEIDDEAVAAALARGVGALARFCAPNGEALYFGRGCNSAYGYASALYGVSCALERGIVAQADRSIVAHAVPRMGEFLLRMRQPDGSVRAYPTRFEAERLGWDDYVHRLDYNAFTAFLLLQMPIVKVPPGGSDPPRTFHAGEAGLVVRERDGVFAAFSTRGQLNTGSYLFGDARYAGMQPLTLQCGACTVIPPPPHNADSPMDPSWVGFMPVLSIDGETWAVRTYADVCTTDGETVAIIGRGCPSTLRAGLRHRLTRNGSRHGRLLQTLARRTLRLMPWLSTRIPPAHTVVLASGVWVTRAVILLPRFRCLCMVERVDGRFDRGWSTIRLAGSCAPTPDGYRFILNDGEGRIWIFPQPTDGEIRQVFTSNGPAYVLRVPVSPGVVHLSAVCFGPKVTISAEPGQGSRIVVALETEEMRRGVTVDLDDLQVVCG